MDRESTGDPERSPLPRLATRGMQVVLAGLLGWSLLARNVAVGVNAALALAVTFLPAVLERDHDVALNPWLALWLTTAVLLHALGMVGLYDRLPWWDHLTHTLSATVVAGVGYVTARALAVHSDAVTFPPGFTALFVVLFTLAFGVLWEVLEFGARMAALALGVEPVLVQYGLPDTLTDLVFDAVGAAVVGLFGAGRLSGTVDALAARLSAGEDGRQ